MIVRLRFHPDVYQELRDAYQWYESKSEGLGEDLMRELERTYPLIQTMPKAWPQVAPGVRRCLLKRFPYGILYREVEQGLVVVAVMHLSRRPGYWRTRIE